MGWECDYAEHEVRTPIERDDGHDGRALWQLEGAAEAQPHRPAARAAGPIGDGGATAFVRRWRRRKRRGDVGTNTVRYVQRRQRRVRQRHA